MTKEDVRIILTSTTGKNVYIQAWISRTLARKIETLLEENNVAITPHILKNGTIKNENRKRDTRQDRRVRRATERLFLG